MSPLERTRTDQQQQQQQHPAMDHLHSSPHPHPHESLLSSPPQEREMVQGKSLNLNDTAGTRRTIVPPEPPITLEASSAALSPTVVVPPKKTQRNVSFGASSSTTESQLPLQVQVQVHIRSIPHYSEWDEETRAAVWCTPYEMNRTLQEARETARAMEEGSLPLDGGDDEATLTPRGLEYMTAEGFDITTSSLDVVKLVLEEQANQRAEAAATMAMTPTPDSQFSFALDTEVIADTVASISRHRSRIAHLAGMKDARGIYGDGNFQTTVPASPHPRRSRSRSVDRKYQHQRGGGSGGDLRVSTLGGGAARNNRTTRRQRGPRGRASRGPQPREERQSAPGQLMVTAAGATVDVVEPPTMARSSAAF